MSAPATLEIDNHIAVLTLRAADRGNAMDYATAELLARFVGEAISNPAVRCLLLMAEGRNFCVGGNLDAADPANPETPERLRRMLASLRNLLIDLATAPFPILASVNGVAAGAGFGLALAADYILAGKSARFITAFAKIGLSPDTGVSFQLARRLDPVTALDLALRSPNVTADEAAKLKLVWKVSDDNKLASDSRKFAAELAQGPTKAFAVTRRLMGVDPEKLGRHLDAEAASIYRLIGTSDYAEGILAFRERRPAKFIGA